MSSSDSVPRPKTRLRREFEIDLSGERYKVIVTMSCEETLPCLLCKETCFIGATPDSLIELIRVNGERPLSTEGLLAESARAEVVLILENDLDLEKHPCAIQIPEAVKTSQEEQAL